MLLSRETIILFVLLIATGANALVAWSGASTPSLIISASTIAIAGFKMRLIAFEFMEVGKAPLILRIFMTGWVIAVTIVLITIYNLKHL